VRRVGRLGITEGEFGALAELFGPERDGRLVARHKGQPDGDVQRHRHHETAVIVCVPTNEVHAAGPADDAHKPVVTEDSPIMGFHIRHGVFLKGCTWRRV